MKSRLLHLICPIVVFFLAFFLATISNAQEIETASHDSTTVRNPEENIYAPQQDERSVDRMPSPLRDSSSFRPAHHPAHQKSKPTQENRQVEGIKDEKEDSVISFNFLYYIIKKFKLSDITDNQ